MSFRNIKCVVVGDSSAIREGNLKTALLISYTTNKYPLEHVPISCEPSSVKLTIDEEPCTLALYDTAGQEELYFISPALYTGTDVFLVCFSVVVPTSFHNVKTKWVPAITKHCPKTPYIIVGLEIDLRDDATVKQPITQKQGHALAKELNAVKYVECSAYTRVGLQNVFNEAACAAI